MSSYFQKKSETAAQAGNIAGTVLAAAAAYGARKMRAGFGGYGTGTGQNKRRRGAVSGRKRKRKQMRTSTSVAQRCKRDIKMLKRRVESGMGTYVYKLRSTTRLLSSVNQVAYSLVTGSNTTNIEGAIDNLPVFNPALPGTYTFVDFTSGTQQKEVEIASTYSYCLVKNNYDAPVRCTIYVVVPKVDTSISATTAMSNGLTDEGSGLGLTTPLIGPRDSEQFNDLYRVKYKVSKELVAGQTMKASFRAGSFQYDPSFVDNHTSVNQKAYKAHSYLIRIEGVLGHDTANDEQGYLPAGIDISRVLIYTIKYEAGADIKYIEVDDNANSFTVGGVVSSYSDVTKETYKVNT